MDSGPTHDYRHVGRGNDSLVSPLFKKLVSPVLDPIGNRVLSPPACGRWGVRLHGDRCVRRIALTFDDGPVEGGTERVLETLGELGVRGTFFCIGANTLQHPKIVERAVMEGHVIGNHSMHHSRINGVSWRDLSHFLNSEAVLKGVLGRAPRFYRPPWGWSAPWEVRRLRQHGLEPIGWDIYRFDDFPAPDGGRIGRAVIRAARPGSIALFHDGSTHALRHEVPETVKALRILIPALLDQGYEFVTIPILFGLDAFKD